MNKQDYITKIKASALSEDKKNMILALLEKNDLDFTTKELIKDILQDEVDGVFSAAGISIADDPDAHAAASTFSDDLNKIQADLENDMAFVEAEMGDLETMAIDLDKSFDQSKIDSIKAELA